MKNKYYFISDIHLGLYPEEKSKEREKLIVNWLESIKNDAKELFLVGDIFDFWYEYKRVVPKGFVRFLGKLAELSDNGIVINFITGNHDQWVRNYFIEEIGMNIYKNKIYKEINGLKILISHGDGIGPGEYSYKILKYLFNNKFLKWIFNKLHPDIAMWIGKNWSKHSRYGRGIEAGPITNLKEELQIIHALNLLQKEHFDYIIYGHRHIPYIIKVDDKSTIVNLGDWITNFTYGVLENKTFNLKSIYSNIKILESKI